MTTKRLASLVLVDTALVAQEVLVNGESTSERAVGVDVSLDIIRDPDVIGLAFGTFFVILVAGAVRGLTFLVTCWLNLRSLVARWFVSSHVMLTWWHGVRVAGVFAAHLTACNDSLCSKPVPWLLNLSTIAAFREAG